MKQRNIKKLLILNSPYLLFALIGTKLGQAARLAPGADLSGKLLNIMRRSSPSSPASTPWISAWGSRRRR